MALRAFLADLFLSFSLLPNRIRYTTWQSQVFDNCYAKYIRTVERTYMPPSSSSCCVISSMEYAYAERRKFTTWKSFSSAFLFMNSNRTINYIDAVLSFHLILLLWKRTFLFHNAYRPFIYSFHFYCCLTSVCKWHVCVRCSLPLSHCVCIIIDCTQFAAPWQKDRKWHL